MRSYSGLLVLEDIFDYVPTNNPDLVNFALGVFNPNVPVVMVDCGTTLGNTQPVNYQLEGKVELATDLVISKNRIDQLLFEGTYTIATRTLDTCVAPGGVCQKCYAASRQTQPLPVVGSRITIYPEYEIMTDVLSGTPSQTVYPLTLNSVQYSNVYVYIQGVIQGSSVYSISGKTLTLTNALTEDQNIVVRYTSINRAPFLVWLAGTYSGSMLGMQPLPALMLPIRSLLLTSLIPQNRLELLVEYTNNVKQIPTNLNSYSAQIKHPLEKALYILALNSIFSNVTA
jgi:hypothetical protein